MSETRKDLIVKILKTYDEMLQNSRALLIEELSKTDTTEEELKKILKQLQIHKLRVEQEIAIIRGEVQ